jgi:hypothetical protein
MTALVHVYYPELESPKFVVRQIYRRYADGRTGARRTFKFAVVANPRDGAWSEALDALELAYVDDDASQALHLMRDELPGWANVYDVFEFALDRGLVDRNDATLKLHKQTANHYRHLGRPPGLPPNAPSLEASRKYAADLLAQWLAQRLRVTRTVKP